MFDNILQPLVSCVMPTYNRRAFIPHAIRYFLRQDYENKELIIIDDGTDNIKDLIPECAIISYFRLEKKMTLGAKLNLACNYAKGTVIANWDDDDWYAPRRLKYQVNALNETTAVCGINHLLYYDLRKQVAFQYIYPPDQRTWILGSSLCYTKDLWLKNNFEDINIGMDALFVWSTTENRISVLPDPTISVHMIHEHNVSAKVTTGDWWHHCEVDEIRKIMDDDWRYYQEEYPGKVIVNTRTLNGKPIVNNQNATLKNIYACLVHESNDCIIDLVRNLHFHDPDSVILLYNGSENPDLLKMDFPFEKFKVVIHPAPSPVKHGYLHQYALSCMEFALHHFSFDILTIVDSDQLALRPGYTAYISGFLASKSNIGMLSNKPERLTADNRDVWTSIQAFMEYELWKPFLQNFPQGENKFVHWTFWPSTVFTSQAIKDLIKLFKENKQLQTIMQQTKIWATEEIILPTLIRLLGYEIEKNPCCDDLVQYQQSYSPEEINRLMSIPNAFWIHPVTRKYEDPVRKHTRETQNHYFTVKKSINHQENKRNMMLTLPLLHRIKEIEGWFDDQEADLLISTTLKACIDLPAPHSIVEIGSYHGKSTVVLGNVVKTFFPGVKVYAIDPHDGHVGATDQSIESLPPSLEMFKKNIENEGLAEVVEMIKNFSFNVSWELPISLLFIDGLHDYCNVARDFWHFSDWVKQGGYIAFHDYADYYPGVMAFVDELTASGSYQQVNLVKSLIVLQKV